MCVLSMHLAALLLRFTDLHSLSCDLAYRSSHRRASYRYMASAAPKHCTVDKLMCCICYLAHAAKIRSSPNMGVRSCICSTPTAGALITAGLTTTLPGIDALGVSVWPWWPGDTDSAEEICTTNIGGIVLSTIETSKVGITQAQAAQSAISVTGDEERPIGRPDISPNYSVQHALPIDQATEVARGPASTSQTTVASAYIVSVSSISQHGIPQDVPSVLSDLNASGRISSAAKRPFWLLASDSTSVQLSTTTPILSSPITVLSVSDIISTPFQSVSSSTPSPTPASRPQAISKSSSSLSHGAIAGIVIGSLAGVLAVVLLLLLGRRWRRRQQNTWLPRTPPAEGGDYLNLPPPIWASGIEPSADPIDANDRTPPFDNAMMSNQQAEQEPFGNYIARAQGRHFSSLFEAASNLPNRPSASSLALDSLHTLMYPYPKRAQSSNRFNVLGGAGGMHREGIEAGSSGRHNEGSSKNSPSILVSGDFDFPRSRRFPYERNNFPSRDSSELQTSSTSLGMQTSSKANAEGSPLWSLDSNGRKLRSSASGTLQRSPVSPTGEVGRKPVLRVRVPTYGIPEKVNSAPLPLPAMSDQNHVPKPVLSRNTSTNTTHESSIPGWLMSFSFLRPYLSNGPSRAASDEEHGLPPEMTQANPNRLLGMTAPIARTDPLYRRVTTTAATYDFRDFIDFSRLRDLLYPEVSTNFGDFTGKVNFPSDASRESDAGNADASFPRGSTSRPTNSGNLAVLQETLGQ